MTETPTSFSIKTEVFEGPLELLIELIEKRKLLVNDISLASVTDEYMRHVAEMERNPLRETAQFVALASTLLLIKSKSLLPVFELTEEEEESIEDLQDRLKLYQIYRNAGTLIADIFNEAPLYARQYTPPNTPIFTADKYTTLPALQAAIGDVVKDLPKKAEKPKVQVKKSVTLESMIARLEERIASQMNFKFREFTGDSRERNTVIVGFLAILEMVKQGKVIADQSNRFEDINITREGTDLPRYI